LKVREARAEVDDLAGRSAGSFTKKEDQMSALDVLERSDRERAETEARAELARRWLAGEISEQDPPSPTEHSPALRRMQAEEKDFHRRHGGSISQAADAAAHAAKLDERNRRVAEAHENSPNVHRAGTKARLRAEPLGGGAVRHVLRYEKD
jgi:hypothetical protein